MLRTVRVPRAWSTLASITVASLLVVAGITYFDSKRLVAADTPADSVRLTPISATLRSGEGESPEALIDRATHSAFLSADDSEVVIALGTPREVTSLKLYGPAPYQLTVKANRSGAWETIDGLERLDLRNLSESWHRFEASLPVSTDKLLLVLNAKKSNKSDGIKELEIWGKAPSLASKSARDLLDAVQSANPPAHVRLATALPEEARLGGVGGGASAVFNANIDAAPTAIRRAWLVYESQGAGHWISTRRSVNGGSMLGGVHRFGASAWTTQLEPVDPSLLAQGNNTITFSALNGEVDYAIRGVQLLLELDNGTNFVEQLSAYPSTDINNAYTLNDGDANTGWTPYPSGGDVVNDPSISLLFDKPTVLERVTLSLRNRLDGKIEVAFYREGEWRQGTVGPFLGKKLSAGENQLAISSEDAVEGVQLRFVNGEGSSAEITEIQPVGSGVGYTWGPAIRLTYPEGGEYYGNEAHIRAYVQPLDNGTGPAAITVAGLPVATEDGSFEATVSKEQAGYGADAEDAPWQFLIEAVYPDGQRLTRTVYLNQYDDASQTQSMRLSASSLKSAQLNSDPYTLENDEGILALEDGAMDEPASSLTISSLTAKDLPPLDPGMTNVTRGPRKGYRFGPHGKKFKKNIQVKLPYDKKKLPPGMTVADIRTYYFDEESGHWRALERVKVDEQTSDVISHTNHFTDMINATLVLPEHPQAAGFNPTQIKDIKAADPGAGINLIEPPEANNMGDARLSYPIEIPPGRNGMQPQLAIQYSSGGGNGWMGLGWDLSVPSISVDTRWGVPRYDMGDPANNRPAKETETYLLGGEMLSPTAHRDEFINRLADREYQPRIEGQFRKIIRHGKSTKAYWWEVIDKSGNHSFYGATPDNPAVIPQKTVLADDNGNIFRWQLLEQRDAYGNSITYQYSEVEHAGNGGSNGRQLYLSTIGYTGYKGKDGPYKVELLRDRQLGGTEVERKDIQIDARGGFKQVTADLLRRIEVKFNDDTIRIYGLQYETGVFGKTRLKAITQYANSDKKAFNRHEFKYYDDLESDNSLNKLAGTKGPDIPWDVPSDNVSGDLFLNSESISLLGGSESRADGGNFYKGISYPEPDKGSSVGHKNGSTSGTTTTLTALMDMDGDGLPDKVYRKGGGLKYRKNLGAGTNGSGAFSGGKDGEHSISGISHIGKGSSSTRFDGASFNYGVSYNESSSDGINTQTIYFADVNGDGLSDQVNGPLVKFGYVDKASDEVKYSGNSSETEVELTGNRTLSGEGLLENRQQLYQQMLADNPLMDTVRVWSAPFKGKIDISGRVTLIRSGDEERIDYPADGVRVAMQHNGEEIWHLQIAADDYTPINAAKTGVPVEKGDRIYFRVGSNDNGKYDQLSWAPEIRYSGVDDSELQDENGLPVYRYSADNDFVAFGRDLPMAAPYQGTIKLSGTLEKLKETSDDVSVELRAVKIGPNGETDNYTILYSKTLEDSETGIIELSESGDFAVDKSDFLYLTIRSDSVIDMKALDWTSPPTFRYTSAYRESVVLTNATPVNPEEESAGPDPHAEVIASIEGGSVDVDKLEDFRLYYNADSYSLNDLNKPYKPWTAPKSGEFLVRPQVTPPVLPGYFPFGEEPPELGYLANGEFAFTVKRRQELIAKQREVVYAEKPFQFNQNGTLGMLEEGSEYYFDFATRNNRQIGSETANRHSVTLSYLEFVRNIELDEVPVAEAPLNPMDTSHPRSIPGFTVAGGTVVKFKPIVDESQQALADAVTTLYVVQIVGTGDTATYYLRTLPINAQTRNQFQHLVFDEGGVLKFYFIGDNVGEEQNLGLAYEVYSLTDTTDVASRLSWRRDHHLGGDMYRNWGYFGFNGNDGREVKAIEEKLLELPKGGKNADLSEMLFIPAVPIQEKGDNVPADEYGVAGTDRWVVGDELWWIMQDGLSTSRNGTDRIEVPSDAQYAGAVGVMRQSLTDGDTVGGGALNINYSTGDTDSRSLISMIDINGDKFPDIVSERAIVFTGPRGGFYGGPVNDAYALSNSNTEVESISAGGSMLPSSATKTTGGSEPKLGLTVTYNKSKTWQTSAYLDMNGDGLPDRVDTSSGKVRVRLNYGYRFASESEAVEWGSGSLSTSQNQGITPEINPGWKKDPLAFGGGVSVDDKRSVTSQSLMDMNGDGLVDAVHYDYDIKSQRNRIMVAFNNGVQFLPAVEWSSNVDSGVGVDRSISQQGGGYVSTYIPLCYTPFGIPVCFIVINPGKNTSKTVSRQEVQWSDINGDGNPDYLVSTRDDQLNVRLNRTGRTNLLKRVERPLGGAFTLDYVRTGNTYEQPQSRYALARVEVDDGIDNDYSPNQITRFEYSGGYYSRIERDFYGFASVITEQLGDDGKPLRRVESDYRTDSYYSKGLLAEERLFGKTGEAGMVPYRKTHNSYDLLDLGTHKVMDQDDAQSLTAIVWPQLKKTEKFFYEGDEALFKSTSQSFSYDDYGNVSGYSDTGDSGKADNISATIKYSAEDVTCRGRHILNKAASIVVRDGNDKLLRQREGKIDCSNAKNGSMTQLHQYLSSRSITHLLDYDGYGNLTSIIGPDDERNENTSVTIKYDETLDTYPVRVTDHFGLSVSSTYDYRFGKKLSQTDTNGNTISYTLDDFGRIDTVTGPYQQGSGHNTIDFDYHPEAMPAYAITRHYDRFRSPGGQDTIDTVLFTDGIKRIIQTKKDADIFVGGTIKPSMIISGRVSFDALGRAVEQYQPGYENKGTDTVYRGDIGGNPTLTEYDALDRTVKMTLPDSSFTRTDYDLAQSGDGNLRFHTLAIDAKGNRRESYRDVRELITTVREYVKDEEGKVQSIDTRYVYDALKQITDVYDAKNHHTAVKYDMLGRRISIDNPDTGKVEYGYNLNGDLRFKLTPNLHKAGATLAKGAIEYVYDHDRLVNIRYPNAPANDAQGGTPPDPIDVTYTYGENTPENAEAGRVGRIVRVDHQSGYEERWYGKLGEMVQERKWVQIPGDLWNSGQKHNQGTTQPEEYEVFTTQYQYDTFGRLQNMVFPDGEKLTYRYNAGGLPQSVHGTYKRNPYPYVTLIGYDEYEQRVRVEMGNGAKTDYSYDPKLRRLATLQTESNGYRFQNLSYDYDKVGNITDLTNQVDPPSSGMGGHVRQHFDYDELNRLVFANGSFQGNPDTTEKYTLSMSYDTIHNITRKNQRHWVEGLDSNGTKHGTTYDWSYRYTGAQPHAPTHIGERDAASGDIVGRTFSYDANGNQAGWSNDKNANRRSIEWDDENRIQSVDDKGQYSQYSYDDAGQRVIKQSRQNLTVYVNQFFTERNGSIGSKHIFVGNSRVLTKVTGGTQFIRSYDGVTDAKLPPGQAKQSEKTNNGKAGGKAQEKSNNGKHLGQQKNADKANNGKGNGKSQANNNTRNNNANGDKRYGVNGIEHRSDRANEVAQNTCKNKHLREQYCDENGNVVVDTGTGISETGGTDTTTATGEPFMEEVVQLGSQGEQLFYYHSDHLGSTGYVTRENGELHEHIQYFPFGETWVQQGGNTEKDPYLFTAKELDEETGLYYFGARYYDPRTSVWQSADPIIEKFVDGGGNSGFYNTKNLGFYSYSYNNPVRLLDPDGNNPGAFTYPGVMPIVDMKSGYGALDHTLIGAANTALNIVGGTVNIAVDAVGAVGSVGEEFAGEIQSASGALPGPGQGVGRATGFALFGVSRFLSRIGDLNKIQRTSASFIQSTRLEVEALNAQGLSRSEAFAQIRSFNAGNADDYVFHFTTSKGARGILNDRVINPSTSGVAGPGVYTGTTPTPSWFTKNFPFAGWGLGGKGANTRIPVLTTQQGMTPWLPPKTKVFRDPLPIGEGN